MASSPPLQLAEFRALSVARKGFIPVGEPLTALPAIAGVISGANDSILFIDSYADSNLLRIPPSSSGKNRDKNPDGQQIVETWATFGSKGIGTPIRHRAFNQFSTHLPYSLHDRLVIMDSPTAWSLVQSSNRLTTISQTAIVRLNNGTSLFKVQAYQSIWPTANSQP